MDLRVEDELVREELDQPGVQQDPRGCCVEAAADDGGCGAIGIVGCSVLGKHHQARYE